MTCFCSGGCGNHGCYCKCRCRCYQSSGYHCWRCGCWVGQWQVHHCCQPIPNPIRPRPWRRDPHWRGDIICKASEAARSIR